tara:strand:+ start:3541 stop:4059 length:519 start_codon:yes stop_codon:yes gene_type:complete
MPVLTLHYRNFNDPSSPSTDHAKFSTQKLRMSSLSVPIQNLTLTGYAVNLRKSATLDGGASYDIPDHLLISFDEITSQQINNLSPPKTHNGTDYLQTHALQLPLSDNLNTIQFGMNLDFLVNKRLDREITISIQKYDSANNIVPMTTSALTSGQVSIDHLILYFTYQYIGAF